MHVLAHVRLMIYEPMLIISVILSPLSNIRPSAFRMPFLIDSSSAIVKHKIHVLVKPMIVPLS